MKNGERIRTSDGRLGVVSSVSGSWIEVVFPDGIGRVHLDDVKPVSQGPVETLLQGTLGDAIPYGLRLQALYLQHAYRFDPRSGLSNARIEPNLHQVFIADLVTNKLQPRMILADEVGLGKTVEAGLILKELRAREVMERVLIVCPASLQYQWQAEMRSKFNEDFEILTSAAAKYLGQGGANPFLQRNSIICSLPFASDPKRAEQIIEAPWDLVIFDEAHRVRRWLESRDKPKTTRAYRLADDLKDLVAGLLLLTATPMQLHPFELYSLIELVEPGMYVDFASYDSRRKELPRLNDLMISLKKWHALSEGERADVATKHSQLLREVLGDDVVPNTLDDDLLGIAMDGLVSKHPLAGVMVRNRKAELGGFAGREASQHLVQLGDDELELYQDVATYLRESYNRATARKQQAIGFLMVTYHKMLASSSYAIHQSLKRRVAKLRKQLAGASGETKVRGRALGGEYEDPVELSEVVEELEALDFDPTEAEAEIVELEALVDRLSQIRDSKASELLDLLEWILERDAKEKIVIFTQFKETQSYLKAQLELAGINATCFHGSLNIDEKEDAIRQFRKDAQVLISTEAGGEGRNLQFAHILVNYDLPWNPMKVEQRIGRLDRIGQRRQVFIYNLACKDTIEERVLDVLGERIRLFSESVGSLDPILGLVEQNLAELVMSQFERFDERFEAFAVDIDRMTREARANERVLADFVLDRASLRRDRANELLGETPLASHIDLFRVVEQTLDYFGGTVKRHVDGGHVVTLSPRLSTKLRTRSSQLRGVFDPVEALAFEDLDFFAIGHELIDKIINFPIHNEAAQTTAHRVSGLMDGPYLEIYYEIRAEGSAVVGKVIRHRVARNGQVNSEEVISLPLIGEPIEVEIPDWLDGAREQSRHRFDQELELARELARDEHLTRQQESLDRAARIFQYRKIRLRRRIDEDAAWIQDKERFGSDRERRVLPARRGKLAKDTERLEHLVSEFEGECDLIKATKVNVTGVTWAAALAVGA